MQLTKNARFLAAVVLLAVVVSLATAGALPRVMCLRSSCERVPAEGTSRAVVRNPPVGSVRIRGAVSRPLSPGVGARLNLVMVNHNPFPVTATRLTVRLGVATAPQATAGRTCTPDDFRVTPARAGLSVAIAPYDSTTLFRSDVPRADWPMVEMLNRPANQDGCKGARLTLRFTAAARQAGS